MKKEIPSILKKQPIPTFNKWTCRTIECTKVISTEYSETTDCAYQFIFWVAISPDLKTIHEYRVFADAIEKKDGALLNDCLSAFEFNEIVIKDTKIRKDDEFFGQYKNEKFVYVYNVDIYAHQSPTKGFISGAFEEENFFFIPKNPTFLIHAVNLFNAISFENTSSFIQLQDFWMTLHKIRNLSFIFKNAPIEYDKLFIPTQDVRIHPGIHANLKILVKELNQLLQSLESVATRKPQLKNALDNHIKEILYDFIRWLMNRPLQIDCFAQAGLDGDKIIKFLNKNHFIQDFPPDKFRLTGNIPEIEQTIRKSFPKHYRQILDLLHESEDLINQCGFCYELFPYIKGKKFCSIRSEGKDCGTPARNKRHYSKHKNRILPRAREYARKYRAE